MNILSLPRITNLNPSFYMNNLKQNSLSFKGQSETDTFERTSTSPELKRGQILNKKGEIFTRPDTNMFRHDLNWTDFGYYLKDRFLWEDRVNIYDYACSTGEEAYTLSMLLQHITDNNAEKFFPIYARDINDDLINKNILNQHGEKIIYNAYIPARYNLSLDGTEIEQYVTLEENPDPNSSSEIEKLTEKVTKPVEFSCANILDDIENIDSDTPSVIMCRNMWPYVNPGEYEDFAVKLYDKLAKGSVVVLGSYDYKGEEGKEDSKAFPANLLKAGFKPARNHMEKLIKGSSLIFEKN